MDLKSDIALPIVPAPAAAAPGHAVEDAPEPASALSAPKAASGQDPDQAAIRKFLRDALNVELVPNRELRIEFENDLHVIVVKVLDKDSGELVRQIPMPESLTIARSIRAQMSRMANEQRGFAVDQEA